MYKYINILLIFINPKVYYLWRSCTMGFGRKIWSLESGVQDKKTRNKNIAGFKNVYSTRLCRFLNRHPI